ncbi:shikimate dehydrogenase [Telluria beijingensis]|uniref:shikimate dehydrogenase n=1 Tax=Telluria beijingensis TaxID=3068633 RepID=UPI0027961B64|nr:shikimate dehydrogenase [Massilia sp. REN29]
MSDRYCVIGNPIAHSKSPQIHAAYALQTGQDLAYERCLAPLDGFEATVRRLVAEGYRGANVTLPFKLEAARLATRLAPRARAAGAVNTLIFADGEIVGDNTDGPGLVADIVRNAGVPLGGKRILLLGAGGAARGALLPLLEEHPRQIVIANRTLATAEKLVADFADHADRLAVTGFADVEGSFDVVVNATSASLAADVPPVPPAVFGPGVLALDMMYGAQPTVFMAFAASHGASVRDGLGMLVEQAAEAFLLWRGVRPDTAPVMASMRQS